MAVVFGQGKPNAVTDAEALCPECGKSYRLQEINSQRDVVHLGRLTVARTRAQTLGLSVRWISSMSLDGPEHG